MYHVYILRCSDNSLYVGYTTNLEARLKAHNMGFGGAHTFKRRPVPRRALRFDQQKSWFLDRLPGHVLIVRKGPFCERITESLSADARSGSRALAAIEAWPRRFPHRRLRSLKRLLWYSDLAVAWIDETGRRPGNIAERALALRWAPAGMLCG